MVLTTKTTKKKPFVKGSTETETTTGVEQGGKFYPTTNPDFKPAIEGTTTQIKFNQNGSVDYTPKGGMETFNLSKEEYSALQGKKGFVTDKTKAIQAQQLNPLQAQQEALAEQQAEELQSLGQEDFTKLGEEQPKTNQEIDGQQVNMPIGPPLNRLDTGIPIDAQRQQFMADTAAQAGGLALGVLGTGLAGGAAMGTSLPTLNLAGTASKVKAAITSLRNVKILGALGAAYGILTNSKVRDVEGDINDMVSLSRTLASQVSSGADPVEVRQQLVDMENEVRDKIAEMNVAKKYSIKDRLIGSDSQEYARKQLTLLVLRRQAVERYMLTNDLNGFNSFMGAQSYE